jgi:hypothetical protein
MKTYGGGSIAPRILNLVFRWRVCPRGGLGAVDTRSFLASASFVGLVTIPTELSHYLPGETEENCEPQED